MTAFNNVSKIVELICDKFSIPVFVKVHLITYLWSNKDKCIEIENEVKKIWQFKK
jgi:hypothetical protein